jgi:hypothetical protein
VPFGFGGGDAKSVLNLDTDGIVASAIQSNWQPMEGANQIKANQQARHLEQLSARKSLAAFPGVKIEIGVPRKKRAI